MIEIFGGCRNGRFRQPPVAKGKEAMWRKLFLLSLGEALPAQGKPRDADAEVLAQMLAKLDRERLQKVNRIKSPVKKLESAGGGLLLQFALQEALDAERKQTECAEEASAEAASACSLTISELLNAVAFPLPLEYIYKGAGKPYFKDYPYYFSLSHSGDYVLCAISDEEIGADIQEMKPCDAERIATRFFTEEEKEKLRKCREEGEKLDCFYEIWSCKEAYGKMTGEGVGKALGVNISQSAGRHTGQPDGPLVRQLPAPEGYKIAVCVKSRQKSFQNGDERKRV